LETDALGLAINKNGSVDLTEVLPLGQDVEEAARKL
jgi:hypothetical protein